MGTRASFWVGDPCDMQNRRWLGCVAWDAYPGNFPEMCKINMESDWLSFIEGLKPRDDFADPANGGFPFPWTDDLFLTDYTYAFFGGRIQVACSYSGWASFEDALGKEDVFDVDNPAFFGVPAPSSEWDRGQPDSIIVIG